MYAFFYQCISLQSINAGFVVCRLRNAERKRNLGVEKERKRLRAELAVNISYFLLFNSLLNFLLLFSLLLLREFFIGVCSAWAQLFFVPFFVRVFVFICFFASDHLPPDLLCLLHSGPKRGTVLSCFLF